MMNIYDFELSGHAHRARLLASLLNLKVNLIEVDLANRAHKQPDYLAKNPFGQVPVLEDGNTVVTDSNAILIYLATQYDQDRSWYPDSPEIMAQIQVWLSKAANELAHGPAAARLITVFGAPLDHDVTLGKSSALLSIMEQHLTGRYWFVGEHRTIADIALYSYIAHAPEGGVDLSEYPEVCAWLSRVEQLPGFVAMPTTETDAKKALI